MIFLMICGIMNITTSVYYVVLLRRVGRRKPLVIFFMICGIMNITTVFIMLFYFVGLEEESLL